MARRVHLSAGVLAASLAWSAAAPRSAAALPDQAPGQVAEAPPGPSAGGRSGPPPRSARSDATRRSAAPDPPRPKPEAVRPPDLVATGTGPDDRERPGPDQPGTAPDPGRGAPPTETIGRSAGRVPGVLPTRRSLIEDPDRLVGLERDALNPLLGRPDLVRREPPAEVWQYARGDCVLDLFLYPDSGRLVVIQLEARTNTAEQQDPRRCLGEILAGSGVN